VYIRDKWLENKLFALDFTWGSSISLTEHFAILFLSPLVLIGVFLDDFVDGQVEIEDVLGVLGVDLYVAVGVGVHVSENLPETYGWDFFTHEAVLEVGDVCAAGFELDLAFECLHHFVDVLFHAGTGETWAKVVELSVVGFVHVFELEALVDFLERFEDFLPTAKHSHPNLPGELFVVFQNVIFIKDPRGNFILGHKVLDNHDSVVKVRVELFLRKPDIVRSCRIAIHIVLVLDRVVVSQVVNRLCDDVLGLGLVVGTGRLQRR
jgi:hypothetical protein